MKRRSAVDFRLIRVEIALLKMNPKKIGDVFWSRFEPLRDRFRSGVGEIRFVIFVQISIGVHDPYGLRNMVLSKPAIPETVSPLGEN